ncbi:MAG: PEP-CTERM sorting domain-containing protein [Okeania sp. SIO2G4]|uniref:PEP-CTERM sorting domain-containing protein n=1 Tax=unclassified Okeania TaxID=2634635 RepID=UPI0013B8C23D|nr:MULTISPECIES: PEP-CTERM sorting domain-containing protein [unclassified Okeania]NEP03497.1 PEP-CTERM sorting domain-containing protein [Okeania sp. SIO4D6]NEP37907.1 PEP-CTERM sorting domain-containing protein [Okeania sp. SIO2H7]NEP70995.1 PEP-CTERM sorting domain-containing protein [Okeania sp. SIO2G5]NEP93822.1 PEP-CTERM sorting domain-containing protein [Okeania sp. SIO2F5]NEQ91698.1 PEP-CTERM sorting domain-containing protein [Okeania sp. SIO2G4]
MFDFRQSITVSVFGVVTSLVFLADSPAQAVTFQLSWTGQILGYRAEGSFSYDETKDYDNGIVRKDDLESFDIAFFDPEGNLIQEFIDNHLTYPDFNFNFDTTTGTILQDGFFDEPNGIDIGEYVLIDPANRLADGLNFWSAAPIGSDGFAIPHVHLTDFGNDFPDLEIGFRRHLDVAFFTRTTAQLLDDPAAGDEFGQRMIASQVPEPTSLLGLGLVSLMGLGKCKGLTRRG